MKVLKIFGIVVGIHVFALILIFANPGCSSTTKPPPPAGDTAAAPTVTPAVSTSSTPPSVYSSTTDTSAPAVTFNPDAPAVTLPSTSSGARVAPTRPGTPVAGALMAEPVTGFTPLTPYTVKSGDNLSTIARKHNTTVAKLTAANNLAVSASLRPGQKLMIPGKDPSPPMTANADMAGKPDPLVAAAAKSAGAETTKHVVKSGEVLGVIAKRYGVRVADIAIANNIDNPARIRPGMELIIPAKTANSGKSGKSAQKSASSATQSTPLPAPEATEPVSTPPPQIPPATSPTVPVIKLDDPSLAPKQP